MISFKNQCDLPWNRLDVRFTKGCDNACAFCVEHDGMETVCAPNPKKMIESTNSISSVDTVGILGGEPMLYPEKVLQYIKGIKNGKKKIYITTSLPVTIHSKKEIVWEIFNLVDGINVSVLGTDWKEHNEVLHARNRHNRFEMIKEIAQDFGDKLRVCINFYRGGIDSKEKLCNLLNVMTSYGVSSFKLNEIQWDATGYIGFEEIMGVPKMKSAYSHGCYKALQNSELNTMYKNVKFMLHRSCCFTQPSVKVSWLDMIKDVLKMLKFRIFGMNLFGVIYEDGRFSNCWIRNRN